MTTAIGLDLGTTSISAIAVREDGRVTKVVSRSHAADVDGLPPGRAEQDPVRLRAVAVEVLRELVAGLDESPASLGVTGQMHGVLLVDDRRRPLTNLITWQDRRANEPIDGGDGKTHLEALLDRVADRVVSHTGTTPAPGFLGVTLAVLTARGEIPAHAHRAVMFADWIAAETTGGDPVTDPTNAASSGLFDVRHGRWSDSLVTATGFDAGLLPDVRSSLDVVGEVSSSFAAETGLSEGIPVANAIGDHQASILGSVPTGEAALHVNIGTGGQIDWPIEEFVRVDGMDTRPLPGGGVMLVGAGLAGGDAFAWVARTARRWASELGADVDADVVYERLLELAGAVDGENTPLQCTPTFRGTRQKPRATGSFACVTNENFGLGEVAHAVLSGIVDGFHGFVETAGRHALGNPTRIIGTGNALERNPLLARLLERRFGLEVWRPVHAEAAAYGAALLGGVAGGTWPSLEAAGRTLRLVHH